MTEYETKKIIYETIVKEIYINPDTALELTKAIYTNLKAAEKDATETPYKIPFICLHCGGSNEVEIV